MHLDRRRFLVDGVRIAALVPVLAREPARAVRLAADGERVLVVVQLTGGNDGLNMVVPHRQDAYHRLRPTLALKRTNLHALDDDHGLHPAMRELGELHAEGRMTVVHGVGYPDPDRSHFRSLEIWHAADPVGPARGVGWLGRLADQIVATRQGSMPALLVGDEVLPLALRGRDVSGTTVRDEESLRLGELPGLASEREHVVEERGARGELAFLRAAARGAYRASERLSAAMARPGTSGYPDLELARKLRVVAKLVNGGFDTRIFLVSLDGFDTHARQAALHAAKLEELARGLGAFQRDLAGSGADRRVLTMVFSEFGRRAAENGSRGTDHGAAAPVLLLGGPVRGGFHGTPPDLERLVDGDVGSTTDFRALYTAIESEWMGVAPWTPVPSCDPFS